MISILGKAVLWSMIAITAAVFAAVATSAPLPGPLSSQPVLTGEAAGQALNRKDSGPCHQASPQPVTNPPRGVSLVLAQADLSTRPRRGENVTRKSKSRFRSSQEKQLMDLYNLGVENFFAGLHDQALGKFNEVLAMDPEFTEAYFSRGLVFTLKGQDPAAVADFTRALQLAPERADIYYNRGVALTRLGQHDRALADFSKALEISPRSPEVYQARSKAYAQSGKPDLAMADSQRAKEVKGGLPQEPSPAPVAETKTEKEGEPRSRREADTALTTKSSQDLKLMPQYNQAVEYFFSGQHDLAIAEFNKIIAANPGFAEAYYNRGLIFALKGQGELAIADFNQVLRLEPQRAEVYSNRGTAYTRLGQFEPAIADFNRALELNPRNSEVFRLRGIAYSKMGKEDLAKADFRQAEDMSAAIPAGQAPKTPEVSPPHQPPLLPTTGPKPFPDPSLLK